jgi:tripartite-type tricarboxylate transporter receptor subunit TctC
VENKPGANGAIAADYVAKSKSDGYTLLLGTSGLSALPLLQKGLPYKLNQDLVPVAITSFTPFLLFAGPLSQASSVANLISYAKANPQRLSVGNGDGTTLMVSELFKSAAGISVISVNYRGGPQMITDIAGGSVDFGFLGATAVMPLAKAGKLRVLGVASAKRLAIAPDVKTLAEQGVNGVVMEPWSGLMAPTGIDRSVIQILERALQITVQSEAFQKRINEIGSVSHFMGADEMSLFITAEQKTMEQLAANAGIKQAE